MKYLSILIPLLFLGCAREDGLKVCEISKGSLIEKYAYIGEIHNEGLDFSYQHLSKQNFEASQKEWTREEASKVITESVTLFLDELQFGEAYQQIARDQIDVFVSRPESEHADPYRYMDVSYAKMKMIDRIPQNIDEMEDYYLVIRDSGFTEKDDLYAALSIAIHSARYWEANLDKWTRLIKQDTKSGNSKGFWGNVVKNDVAYGVAGGIGGALVGGSVTLGIGTIPGWAAGAIGGAIGGSVGAGILQALDRWV